jgi:hypothetical protein
MKPGGYKLRVNWIRLVQPHRGGRGFDGELLDVAVYKLTFKAKA